ncbi:MAG: hypothetical protein ABH881_00750 [bacterium]
MPQVSTVFILFKGKTFNPELLCMLESSEEMQALKRNGCEFRLMPEETFFSKEIAWQKKKGVADIKHRKKVRVYRQVENSLEKVN